MRTTIAILGILITLSPAVGQQPAGGPEVPPDFPPGPCSCAFSPDRKYVLVGYAYDGHTDKSPLLRIIDTETGKEVRSFPGHKRRVDCVAFAADGKQVIANTLEGREVFFTVWDVKTGDKVRTIRGKTDAEFMIGGVSPTGKRLLTWAPIELGDGTKRKGVAKFQVWDVGTGDLLHTYAGNDLDVRTINISPDDKFAMVSCSKTIVKEKKIGVSSFCAWRAGVLPRTLLECRVLLDRWLTGCSITR
jgi:WD40 repeat protein